MTAISIEDVQTWLPEDKFDESAGLDTNLVDQVAIEVYSQLATAYDTTLWIAPEATPLLVRRIISMLYAAWVYDRAFSADNNDINGYATLLRDQANLLLAGVIGGTLPLEDSDDPFSGADGTPSFYPNDRSSALRPIPSDRSLGPASFSMGQVF